MGELFASVMFVSVAAGALLGTVIAGVWVEELIPVLGTVIGAAIGTFLGLLIGAIAK